MAAAKKSRTEFKITSHKGTPAVHIGKAPSGGDWWVYCEGKTQKRIAADVATMSHALQKLHRIAKASHAKKARR